jgi:hypothetical protein
MFLRSGFAGGYRSMLAASRSRRRRGGTRKASRNRQRRYSIVALTGKVLRLKKPPQGLRVETRQKLLILDALPGGNTGVLRVMSRRAQWLEEVEIL